MKRFIAFLFDVDSPGGGWNDAIRLENDQNSVAHFDSIEEAVETAKKQVTPVFLLHCSKAYIQIVDLTTGELVLFLTKIKQEDSDWVPVKRH